MKFETRAQNDMPILASYKPEMQTGNKMAAAAIFVYPTKKAITRSFINRL